MLSVYVSVCLDVCGVCVYLFMYVCGACVCVSVYVGGGVISVCDVQALAGHSFRSRLTAFNRDSITVV